MTLPTVYVDFSVRDASGRLYLASRHRFPDAPAPGDRFIGTDFDEFEVECEVLAIDHVHGRVYHRPVRPAELPGTFSSEFDEGAAARPAELLRLSPAGIVVKGNTFYETEHYGIRVAVASGCIFRDNKIEGPAGIREDQESQDQAMRPAPGDCERSLE